MVAHGHTLKNSKEGIDMGRIKGKLKSSAGASLIIALLFFLICSMVGVSVLAAAKANAGHLSSQRTNEQAYLTVRSAAQLTRSMLEEAPAGAFAEKTVVTTTYTAGGSTSSTTWTSLDTSPHKAINRINQNAYALLSGMGIASDIDLTFTAEGMADATADIKISGSGNNYSLSSRFYLADAPATNYYMGLTATGTVQESTVSNETVDTENSKTTTTVTEYKMNWSNGRLQNGGGD